MYKGVLKRKEKIIIATIDLLDEVGILDIYAAYDEGIRSTILDNKMGCTQGILYFTKTYAEYY